MFTGIIEGMGKIIENRGGYIRISAPWDSHILHDGQSLAIDGCCLTVVDRDQQGIGFQLSPETLSKTLFPTKAVGAWVNLERAMGTAGAFDGHLVTGHVDGVARIRTIRPADDQGSQEMWFDVSSQYQKWLAAKGSVALAGISLTVNELDDAGFSVMLIPHTLAVTTLKTFRPGDELHIEYDMIAKYVDRIVSARFAHLAEQR